MNIGSYIYGNISYVYHTILNFYMNDGYNPYYNEDSLVPALYQITLYGWPKTINNIEETRLNPHFECSKLLSAISPYSSIGILVNTWNKKYIIDQTEYTDYHLFDIQVEKI